MESENQTIASAKSHPIFLGVLRELIINRFYSENNLEARKSKVDSENLQFATWLATIIASSEEEENKQLASTFAILLFLENKDSKGLVKASYIILSRAGNLIASRFFDDIFNFESKEVVEEREIKGFKTHFGTVLNYELGAKLSSNEIKAGELKFIGSDYQKSLWNSLNKTKLNIAISAPTSAGKSYVIQNYLKKIFQENEKMFGIYIVPTRALIAQVSERLKLLFADNISINTAFLENEDPDIAQFQDKEIFIVTPERCLRLIQYSYKHIVRPDFIFLDEIQNIESIDGRGFLFEYVINEIKANWPSARIMLAGPFLKNPEILFEQQFQTTGEKKQTFFSPVFQLKVSLMPSENNKILTAKLHFRNEIIDTIPIEFDFEINKIVKSNKGQALIEMAHHFGKGTKNIIYVNRTDYAENSSLGLSKKIVVEKNDLPKEISDLISLIDEEIHPEYYLVDCLKSKTAFHHGKLPEIIRTEIEYLFSIGKIDNLICTSTLMEGVNLPAEKMFIAIPKKKNIPLSPFEFGNIIGRAGRIRDSLIGSIYCLQTEEDQWAEEKYNTTTEKQIEPAIYKILSIPSGNLLSVLKMETNARMDDPNKDYEHAVCFLKHKFLKGGQVLHDYLTQKKLTDADIQPVLELLSTKLKHISVPSELLKMNPSIDPELQDALYKRILQEGIEKWVIHDNANLYSFKGWDKIFRFITLHNQNNLQGQLEHIFTKLDEIFHFREEAFFNYGISRTVPQMVLYAVKWMRNVAMKDLINGEIAFEKKKKKVDSFSKDEINKLINELIRIYSSVTSFVLVKYIKVVVDYLDFILNEKEKEKYKFILSLPLKLELGTTEELALLLISKGITRSVAIRLLKLIPKEFHKNPLDWLRTQETLKDLSPVYIGYLRRKGFLKSRLKI